MNPNKAADLLRLNGPRFYPEVGGIGGAGFNLDHAFWRVPGVVFLVNMDSRNRTPEQFAEAVLDAIQDFRANYATAQPGVRIPAYGIRVAALGGLWGFEDVDELNPTVSSQRLDCLPGFVSDFDYSPAPGQAHGPRTGMVTTSGHTPTTTQFKIGGGNTLNRPDDALIGNTVEFTTGANAAAGSREITGWTGNVVTVSPAFPNAPANLDACFFTSALLLNCFRFAEGRDALETWTNAFFAELDSLWPEGLAHPEFVVVTTEYRGEPDIEWDPLTGSFGAYVDADDTDPPLLTDSRTLTQWIAEFGTDQSGSSITLPTMSDFGLRSPEVQDVRSLANGAFFMGISWTWQLSFVDRMKQTWPRTRFVHYQLRAGNKRSPYLTQPGEEFYHGEPWPPDIAHSPDYYSVILPYRFTAAAPLAGTVASANPDEIKVETGSEFLTFSDWATPRNDLLRFAADTLTTDLRDVATAILDWNPSTETALISALAVSPVEDDEFFGFVELPQYFEWKEDDIGWAVWAAYQDLYKHTGTLEEVYRQTCVSWVLESWQRFADAWPRHHIVPFLSRWPEDDPLSSNTLTAAQMYPDRAITDLPGYQTRDDWARMLTGAIETGTYQFVIFDPHADRDEVLDAWVEILTKTRKQLEKRRVAYEMMAPSNRNREWREPHLWRG